MSNTSNYSNRRTKQEQSRACSNYALQGGGRAKLNRQVLKGCLSDIKLS